MIQANKNTKPCSSTTNTVYEILTDFDGEDEIYVALDGHRYCFIQINLCFLYYT